MAVKEVFGLEQGNKRKKVTHVMNAPEFVVWSIDSEDKNIAVEKDGMLFRVCADYSFERGYAEGHGYKAILEKGTFKAELDNYCKNMIDHLNHNQANAIKAGGVKKTLVNVNYFALTERMDTYFKIRDNNDAIQKLNDDKEAALLKEREAEDHKKRMAAFDEIVSDITLGENIDGADLVTLADDYEVSIPLRTRGWLLERCNYINATSYSYNRPRGTRGKGSKTACGIYIKVRAAVMARSETK